jgi:hypothetical protein
MRILGTIDHPSLKITVFKMDQRLSVKFENPWYEQTYKFGDDERVGSLEAVQQLVDAAFVEHVLEQFRYMHRTRLEALGRAFPAAQPENEFEEII